MMTEPDRSSSSSSSKNCAIDEYEYEYDEYDNEYDLCERRKMMTEHKQQQQQQGGPCCHDHHPDYEVVTKKKKNNNNNQNHHHHNHNHNERFSEHTYHCYHSDNSCMDQSSRDGTTNININTNTNTSSRMTSSRYLCITRIFRMGLVVIFVVVAWVATTTSTSRKQRKWPLSSILMTESKTTTNVVAVVSVAKTTTTTNRSSDLNYNHYCDCGRNNNNNNNATNSTSIMITEETMSRTITTEWGFLPRPKLHELIADFDSNVLHTNHNVSWLLDFAIIGFPKCATTEQMNWLRQHNEVIMESKEIDFLQQDKPARMISHLYALPNIPGMRGYKSPKDIRSFVALQHVHTYWPTAKLMVGVRHPVRWYESLYNHLTRMGFAHQLPVFDDASGHTSNQTTKQYRNTMARGLFHIHLSKLGKTQVLNPAEKALLGEDIETPPYGRMHNPVFLYEVSQPFDVREDRHVQYRQDLQAFLGLSRPLNPVMARASTTLSKNYHYVMDICDDKFVYLRHELVDWGTAASQWIMHYFMVDPDVTVSSPNHFRQLLETWLIDPCTIETTKTNNYNRTPSF